MAVEVKGSSNGIGLGILLFLIFMVLKLVGVIGWSWWWVTVPLWGLPVLAIVLFCIVAIAAMVFK